MKKMLLLGAILLILVGFGGVLAIVSQSLDGSLSIENITFTGNESITRNWTVNRYATINSGYLNMSGYTSSEGNVIIRPRFANNLSGEGEAIIDRIYEVILNDTTTSAELYAYRAVNESADISDVDKVNDTDWNTYSYYTPPSESAAYISTYFEPNQTFDQVAVRFRKQGNAASAACMKAFCYNYTDESFDVFDIQNDCSGLGVFDRTYDLPNECISNNIRNPNLEIGIPDGVHEWNYSGLFNEVNNRTSDFSSVIQSALDSGDCTGGTLDGYNCTIPFLFHSDTAGILEYSDIDIDYDLPSITNCTGGNVTLNFTMHKESDKSVMNGSMEATFNILGLDYNFTISNQHEFLFCIEPSYTEVQVDATIEYTNDSYAVRTYYLNNATISNETNHIPLYLLETADSTSIVIEVLDENYEELVGVYAKMQRYYVGSNTWETVEIGKTDTQGKALIHAVVEDVFYKFIFEDVSGTLLEEIEPMKFYCVPTYESCKYTFRLAGEIESPYSPVNGLPDVSYSLYYNEDTDRVIFSWSDSSGITQNARLIVLQQTTMGENTICDTITESVSGTIACDLATYNGTFFYYGYIQRSPTKLIDWGQITKTTYGLVFGSEGVFWALLVIITIFLIGIWNPTVSILLATVAFAAMTWIGLIDLGVGVIIYVIILAVLLIWRMRT